MSPNPSVQSVFAAFLARLAVESPKAYALLRNADPTLEEWGAAQDGSYRAGTELLLVTDTDATYDALRDLEMLRESLVVSGRAARLAFIRIDGPTKGFMVFELDR